MKEDSPMLPFNLGPIELGLILLIVAMLFGVGKLPEVFGAIGKGVREFRKESGMIADKQEAPAGQLPQQSSAPMQATAAPDVQSAPSTPAAERQA
jgi:sec-independent protein translocase protein TatA